jgi:peptide deformylase
MSDEVLVIDTGSSTTEKKVIEPLPLYGQDYPMLSDELPVYSDPLPNPIMDNLVERLKLTMKAYGGIGLSANQCGVFERVFVIGAGDFQLVCINPKVIEASTELVKDNEGCLSYPGLFVKIERPRSIRVEFLDQTGEKREMSLEGLTARCFLHELEHMNGKSFTDNVGPVALRLAKQKQQKRIKKFQRMSKAA